MLGNDQFWIMAAIVLIGLAFLLFRPAAFSKFPYKKAPSLLTDAEARFHQSLLQAAEGIGIVFIKVRIADVLNPVSGLGASRRQTALNHIACKHFDFVLCKQSDFSVLAAVELDDKSHNKAKVRARDKLVNGACKAAKLPLVRFKVAQNYDIPEIREGILDAINLYQKPPTSGLNQVKKESLEP